MTDLFDAQTGEETLDERVRRVARDSGLSEAAVRQGLAGDAPNVAPAIRAPINPFSAGLVVIWILTLSLGFIVVIVGASLHGSYSPDAGQPDNGMEELFFGGMFSTIGAVTFAVWIGARMVMWKHPDAGGGAGASTPAP